MNFRIVLGSDNNKAALKTFIHNHSRKRPSPETFRKETCLRYGWP